MITSLIGAVLGVVLGVLFALLISRPLADEGFTLTFPIGTLILLLVLAALFGRVGGDRAGPQSRAARRARARWPTSSAVMRPTRRRRTPRRVSMRALRLGDTP